MSCLTYSFLFFYGLFFLSTHWTAGWTLVVAAIIFFWPVKLILAPGTVLLFPSVLLANLSWVTRTGRCVLIGLDLLWNTCVCDLYNALLIAVGLVQGNMFPSSSCLGGGLKEMISTMATVSTGWSPKQSSSTGLSGEWMRRPFRQWTSYICFWGQHRPLALSTRLYLGAYHLE